jgi:hypothetical protein
LARASTGEDWHLPRLTDGLYQLRGVRTMTTVTLYEDRAKRGKRPR